jgi:hypothetical protein
VNGTSGVSTLPPLPSLQSQRSQDTPSRGVYYDPAHDEPRAAEDEAKSNGRPRTNSGTQPPPSDSRENQNGDHKDEDQDAEMVDASGGGFTAVNR